MKMVAVEKLTLGHQIIVNDTRWEIVIVNEFDRKNPTLVRLWVCAPGTAGRTKSKPLTFRTGEKVRVA
ncbi:hypothetical protein FHR81_002036 [Actinoalloteichus hoggarensis]|uniref:Uncharacterized protein n=1 Tax=Actinoalloteichus hoggarensis TaxID=1470176 RepID=A0A221W6Q1_9PSEU|nr:hypothetical protein [Actinoalloteichus hoggarensis]ASO21067.1 hypothetical protein AHOG_17210 [Actinoalloteichus hoggarensis]MBB5920998.1 hypothetical protein [Actinoalloteichus hoggarensis]